jgi:transaldolase
MSTVLEGTTCEILAASIKSPNEAVETVIAGAQHLSMPLDVIKAMVESDLTQQALEAFAASRIA